MFWRLKNTVPPSVIRNGDTPKNVPYTKLKFVGSTSTWPPSPLVMSNHVLLAADLRIVPLSCVPPQNRAWSGKLGLVAMLVNWAIDSPPLLRSIQSASSSGAVRLGRPPRSGLYQMPPSDPMATPPGFAASHARA